eukprot:8708455-Lingulodinium_polyedra.AAC.1
MCFPVVAGATLCFSERGWAVAAATRVLNPPDGASWFPGPRSQGFFVRAPLAPGEDGDDPPPPSLL